MKIFRGLFILAVLGLTLGPGHPPVSVAAYAPGTYAVAFSPDSRYAAAGWEYGAEESGNLRVWDVQSGAPIAELDCLTDHVFSLAFSPNLKYLACGGFMGIVLFDTTTWTRLRTMPVGIDNLEAEGYIGTGDVYNVMFTPDSRYLLSQSYSGARFWNVRTGELARWFWQEEETDGAFLSPDPHIVLTAGKTQGVWLWDIQTGHALQKFGPRAGLLLIPPPYTTAFSPDGKQILIGSDDGLHLWDIQARTDLRKIGHGGYMGTFSPDGRYVLGQSLDYGKYPMQVWDAQSGQILHEFNKAEIEGEFSPNGKLFLTLEGGTFAPQQIFRLYDVASWKETIRLEGEFRLADVHTFSPDSRYLLVGYLTVGADIWSTETGKLVHNLE